MLLYVYCAHTFGTILLIQVSCLDSQSIISKYKSSSPYFKFEAVKTCFNALLLYNEKPRF